MNRLLNLKDKLSKYPLGNRLLSYIISRTAPYFLTIRPLIISLKPGYAEVTIKKRRKVENHLRTVHAIAICNLCEYTAGICIEATIPNHLRWIPKEMNIQDLKKAKSDLVGKCNLDISDWDDLNEAFCIVEVYDLNNVLVSKATITMKVSKKLNTK